MGSGEADSVSPVRLMPPDVVYSVRPGDDNPELRYSLRSLVHIAHGQVILAGYQPRWARNVGYLPVPTGSSKYKSTTANMRIACESASVSDPFIYMNDDFFVMRPTSAPKVHAGPVREFIAEKRSRYPRDSVYIAGAVHTLQLLRDHGYPDPRSYELHVPLLVHKEPMLRAIALGEHLPVLHKRTVYGNLARLGGQRMADCKIYDARTVPDDDATFVSTDDRSFRYGSVGLWLRGRLNEPGVHERTLTRRAA